MLQLPFSGFEPTPPSVKQIPRVDTDKVDLKDISRSPQRSLSDQGSRVNDVAASQNNLMRSQEVLFKDVPVSLRHPLSDSTNVCHSSQDSLGHHHHQQQQRRLLHPLLARRRSSCVRHYCVYIEQYLSCVDVCCITLELEIPGSARGYKNTPTLFPG